MTPVAAARETPTHIERAAVLLFVLPFMVSAVPVSSATRYSPQYVRLEVVGFPFLAALWFASRGRRERLDGTLRVLAPVALTLALIAAYSPLWSRNLPYGSAADYEAGAVRYVLPYIMTAVFAAVLFTWELFEETVWRVGWVSCCVALAGFALATAGGPAVLASYGIGGLRLRGLMNEPSAWAPVIGMLILGAARRHRWGRLVVVLVAAILTRSPTVFLVAALSVLVYVPLATRPGARRAGTLLVTLALAAAGANFLLTADPTLYVSSQDPTSIALGRLIVGVQAVRKEPDTRVQVQEGGLFRTRVQGNERLASTVLTFDELRASRHADTGLGPGSSVVYFTGRSQIFGSKEGPNSLYAETAFDYGRYGGYGLVGLILLAVVRLRRRPGVAAVFLPFFIASLVNSAAGPELYKFTILGLLVSLAGWGRMLPAESPQPRSGLLDVRGSTLKPLDEVQ